MSREDDLISTPWLILLILFGVSFMLWMSIGAARLASEKLRVGVGSRGEGQCPRRLVPADVAVLIPAHNEELGIAATIEAVIRLVPAHNVHVVADGCDDNTAVLARERGVNVLELQPGRGKAGGIEVALHHFDLAERFAILLIVDADTVLDDHYVERGLRLLDDEEMVALAGYARNTWHPAELPFTGRFLVSYRTRLYTVMQWLKFGQTWRYTNVVAIVPGFASMYRTTVLSHMDLNPPGLVIEDFNMTFELHHKRLGKVAFRPSVFARTQDPDNLPDYYRQITRWWLGFWQTLRRHKLWFSWFSAALVLFLLEVMLAAVYMIVVTVAVLLLALPAVTGGQILQWTWFDSFADTAAPLFTPLNLLLFLFVPDYLLTCGAAAWTRRPSLLVYGFGFLPIRLIDATAILWTLPLAWWTHSNGQWTSPARRGTTAPSTDGTVTSTSAAAAGKDHEVTGVLIQETSASERHADRGRERRIVLCDALIVGTAVVLGALSVYVMPVLVLLAGGILGVAGAVLWSYRRRRR